MDQNNHTGPSERLSDEQLARKIQDGDTGLYGELMGRYEQKIFLYIRKFLSGSPDAEDITQDVFIKCYQNIRSFDPDRKFTSWLYRIAHNECVNFLKKKRHVSLDIFELDTLLPHFAEKEHPVSEFDRQQVRELMEKSLSALDAKYREPLLLYYSEDFDYREIADILKIPVATVGVRLNRGRKLLKDNYEKTHRDAYGNAK